MTYSVHLREDQWERIKPNLPGKDGDVGVTAKDNRLCGRYDLGRMQRWALAIFAR